MKKKKWWIRSVLGVDVPIWKFWDAYSGIFGGIVMGLVINGVLYLYTKLIGAPV